MTLEVPTTSALRDSGTGMLQIADMYTEVTHLEKFFFYFFSILYHPHFLKFGDLCG